MSERSRTGSWPIFEIVVTATVLASALFEVVLVLPSVSPPRGDFAVIGEAVVFAGASLIYAMRSVVFAPLVLRHFGCRRRAAVLRWAVLLTYLTPLLVVALHLVFDYRANALMRVAEGYLSGPEFLVEIFRH